MVRFSPFFFEVVQNFKGNKRRTSDLRNLARSRGKTRSREIAISGSAENTLMVITSLILVPRTQFFFQFAQNFTRIPMTYSNLMKSCKISSHAIQQGRRAIWAFPQGMQLHLLLQVSVGLLRYCRHVASGVLLSVCLSVCVSVTTCLFPWHIFLF